MRRLAVYVALFACLFFGCASTSRTAIALDTLAAVVDPSYAAAVDGCNAALESATTPVEVRVVEARCDPIVDAFEQIRALHDAAAEAVARGDMERAEKLLAEVITRWKGLQR